MNKQPLVTIGIPVYNEEKYLAQSVESAINQDYGHLQILIHDNCSTDSSYEIAQKYANIDTRVTVYKHEKVVNPQQNFVSLVKAASSKYFMFLGGHDILTKDFIKEAVDLMTLDTNIVCVYPKAAHLKNNEFENDIISDNLNTIGLSLEHRLLLICKNVLYGNAIYGLYNREVLEQSLININGGDLLVLFLAGLKGHITSTGEIGYYFRVVRKPESHQEMQERYKRYGFDSNWEFQRVALPFYYVYKSKNVMPLANKTRLSLNMYTVLQRFYRFDWNHLIKFHFKRKNYSLSSYLLLISTFHYANSFFKKVGNKILKQKTI
jgi:glycosyltransferase involved in cell wall biosynthesis